jgi:hypothetical protein
MIDSDLARSFGFTFKQVPSSLSLERRGSFLLAYSGRTREGQHRNVEELGAYIAMSAQPQPRKANLIEVAEKFVRSCSPSAKPVLTRSSVGGRAAAVVEWIEDVWHCAAWFVPSTRGKVLIIEALVDRTRHPALLARGLGAQLVELIEWLPSTRDPRAVPAASVIRPSVGVSSKRDFVLSFHPDTPEDEILRAAKEAGIGLTRAYLQAIREAVPDKPRARRTRAPAKEPARPRPAPMSTKTPHGTQAGPSRARSLIERLRELLKDPS